MWSFYENWAIHLLFLYFLYVLYVHACSVAQSYLTLCDPMEPTRLLCPLDFPGKNTGVGCHFLLQVFLASPTLAGGFFYHWAIWEFFICLQKILHYAKQFFSFIFISWRLITLQYCSGFCHTLTWISHGFTCYAKQFIHLFPTHECGATSGLFTTISAAPRLCLTLFVTEWLINDEFEFPWYCWCFFLTLRPSVE